MELTTLSLHSEAYSASGNLAADGYRKLLGAPSIDLIQTLVREAVQNSCDAALEDGNANVHFRLRTLTPSQQETLRKHVLTAVPADDEAGAIEAFLASETPRVLELCDFGTRGLGGPTRADIAPESSEPTDFVDFLRNVGSRRNTHLGGGTYGYGKTSLYLASRCSMIVVDTQTVSDGCPVRRLIAARLGSAFEASDHEGVRRRFTGRHWWGVTGQDGVVDPAEGDDALAESLGLPARDPTATGTSIMILDPFFEDGDDRAAIATIQEALLWFFWPRLIEGTPPDRRMQFSVFLESEEQELPRPEDFPPLDLFARAMIGLRTDGPGVRDVRSKKPKRLLGRLGMVSGMAGERRWPDPEKRSLFPQRSASIAVMRPVELVVRYYEGEPLADERLEWAGVFIASSDSEVEAAFARAEPPAHDDWQPNSITDSSQATMVRVAIREITQAAATYAKPAQSSIMGSEEGPSLAAVAGILGRALAGEGREGAGPRSRRTGQRATNGRADRVGMPTFLRLERSGEDTLAIFATAISASGEHDNLLKLESALAVEGGSLSAESLTDRPVISAVRHDGNLLGSGSDIDVGTLSGDLEIAVVMPSDSAVILSAWLEERTKPR